MVADGLFSDPASFFRHYYPALNRLISAATGASRSDVDDLVQETLLHAWKNRSEFRGTSPAIRWIEGIARNKIRDRWRSRDLDRRAGAVLRALGEIARIPIPAELLENAELRRRVRGALQALPSEYADLLRQRYLEDLPVRKMAELRGESEKSTESRLHRAREAFRRCMTDMGGDDGSLE